MTCVIVRTVDTNEPPPLSWPLGANIGRARFVGGVVEWELGGNASHAMTLNGLWSQRGVEGFGREEFKRHPCYGQIEQRR